MITIAFRFLAGRFHATPWDRHVNEGAPEWPISPWRILRALLSTWHHKASTEVSVEEVESILRLLGSSVPSFYLPAAVGAHTRHYMPLFKDSTTKVLDTFIHMEEPLFACWEKTELPLALERPLTTLLERMGYLGRAESWVEARLCERGFQPYGTLVGPESEIPERGEGVRLLALQPEEPYLAWRNTWLHELKSAKLGEARARALEKGKDPEKVKLSPKEISRMEESVPTGIIDILEADTGTLRKSGWSRPPGSHWVTYDIPSGLLTKNVRHQKAKILFGMPTVARYTVSGNVRPRLTEAISVAERVRTALMSISRDIRGNASPVFSGKSDLGARLDDDHSHAHILPESRGSNKGEITHLTIYAPAGFDDAAQSSLRHLLKVWGHGGHDLRLALIGFGHPGDFFESRHKTYNLMGNSTIWVSRTPFVLTRHPKKYRDGRPKVDAAGMQIDGPEWQLLLELKRRGLPQPEEISRVDGTVLGGRSVAWRDFRRTRREGGGLRAAQTGWGFRLRFGESISGPLALGYGSHFGLGQFVAE